MTAARFKCRRCGKTGPIFLRPTPKFPATNHGARSMSIHVMDPTGLFCTLRCAAEYGVTRATETKEQQS